MPACTAARTMRYPGSESSGVPGIRNQRACFALLQARDQVLRPVRLVVLVIADGAGLNAVVIEQALRGAGIFTRDPVGFFQDANRPVSDVLQIADGSRNHIKQAGHNPSIVSETARSRTQSGFHNPAEPSFAVPSAVWELTASPHRASSTKPDSQTARRRPIAVSAVRLLWSVESAAARIPAKPHRRRCFFSNKPPGPPHPQSPGKLPAPDLASWGEPHHPSEPPGPDWSPLWGPQPDSSAAKAPYRRCRSCRIEPSVAAATSASIGSCHPRNRLARTSRVCPSGSRSPSFALSAANQ